MGLALKAVQVLTSFHGVTGWGAFQRKAPTGGAANGIPLYTSILFSIEPATLPEAV